jgi:hypothetical protein
VGVHLRIEKAILDVKAAGSGKRDMGASEQFIDGCVTATCLRYADACADTVTFYADVDGLPDHFNQSTSNPARVARVSACETQGKFVVADACEYVAWRSALANPSADLQKRLVASEMSVHLVELLELIETKQQDTHFVV